MNEVAQLQQDPETGRFAPGHCLGSKNAYYHDPNVMESAISEYFQEYRQKDLPTTVTSLALHLGFTGRQALFNYMRIPGRNPFLDIIKRAKARIEADRVECMLNSKSNTIGSIFYLKNAHGYEDKQVQATNIKVTQSYTPEDREALKDLAMQMIEERERHEPDVIDAECVSIEAHSVTDGQDY